MDTVRVSFTKSGDIFLDFQNRAEEASPLSPVVARLLSSRFWCEKDRTANSSLYEEVLSSYVILRALSCNAFIFLTKVFAVEQQLNFNVTIAFLNILLLLKAK